VLNPLFAALGAVLAFYYDHLWANFAVAIALLTLSVLIVAAPLAVRTLRWAGALQRLQPEVMRLRRAHAGDPRRLQQELARLYRAHGVSPASGCLTALLPLPLFYVLYHLIEGLTHAVRVGGRTVIRPLDVPRGSALYRALVAGHGTMHAFGIDLARSALSVHGPLALAYWGVVAGVVAVQAVQSRQARRRQAGSALAAPPPAGPPPAGPTPAGQAPAKQAPPGHAPGGPGPAAAAAVASRIVPWAFAVVAAVVSAGVNVYFLVAGVVRIAQSAVANRRRPTLGVEAEGR